MLLILPKPPLSIPLILVVILFLRDFTSRALRDLPSIPSCKVALFSKVFLLLDMLVSVKTDKEKEYIDIDYQNLEQKFYLVQYQGEIYAVKKISQHELAFYDVVK